MTRWLSLAVFAAVLAPSLAFGQPAEQPPLHAGEWLSGRFVQERHIAGLSAPLHSEGTFVLAAGKGLIWHSEKPFDTSVIITPAGLLQLVDGREAQRIPATRVPFLAQLYDMLAGALGGDSSTLARRFSVERHESSSGWSILLKPLHPDDPAAAALQSIAITGSRFVDTVEVHRPKGDWDQLRFSDQTRSSASLPPADAKLLQMDAP